MRQLDPNKGTEWEAILYIARKEGKLRNKKEYPRWMKNEE